MKRIQTSLGMTGIRKIVAPAVHALTAIQNMELCPVPFLVQGKYGLWKKDLPIEHLPHSYPRNRNPLLRWGKGNCRK